MDIYNALMAIMVAVLMAVGGWLVLRAVWVMLFGSPEATFAPKDAPDLFIKTKGGYRLRDWHDPAP